MKVVGVTGGIGAGKTTICNIFKVLNIAIYSADDRAKWLMQHDDLLNKKLIKSFGTNTFLDGQLNREHLAKIIFEDASKTQLINEMVHPVVAKDFDTWRLLQSSPYVIKEAALMIESGGYRQLDYLINVVAPLDIRISRVKKRDSFRSEKEILAIIDKQASDQKRKEVSDFTIINDEHSLVIPVVVRLHDILKKKLLQTTPNL